VGPSWHALVGTVLHGHLPAIGLRSTQFLFNEYAKAIEWIMTHNYRLLHFIHYLDNFFLAGPPQSFCCQCNLDTFLQVDLKLGMPVTIAMEKVEGPMHHGHVIPWPHPGL